MKGKKQVWRKLLVLMVSASMLISPMSMPVFALDSADAASSSKEAVAQDAGANQNEDSVQKGGACYICR